MNPTIRITGRVEPGTEKNAVAELDRLLHDMTNPTIIYNGEKETAEKLRRHFAIRKTSYNVDLDKDPRRLNPRLSGADYLIILGHHTPQSIHALRTRSRFEFLENRTLQIGPVQDPPKKTRVKVYPTGKKAIRHSRSRKPKKRPLN